ncbi:hypothetical protein [Stenotrophomonas nematodicola]|uniref:Uncharacterized protein n=1 Tax=Stenotrophomonas nematodicola TaxID=2656746 RepID=A0ABW7CU16_9GAMM
MCGLTAVVDPDRARAIIALNDVGDAAYDEDASFIGQLHEQAIWSWDAFVPLEEAIASMQGHRSDTALQASLFRMFSHIMLLVQCHFDPLDLSRIALTDEQVRAARDRVQDAFAGWFLP